MLTKDNYQKYILQIEQKIFHEFDKDANNRFNKKEFPKVLTMITKMIGADVPLEDDVNDIFNLLDVNGDETIDRGQLMSLIKMLFKVLEENNIEIQISKETNIVF